MHNAGRLIKYQLLGEAYAVENKIGSLTLAHLWLLPIFC